MKKFWKLIILSLLIVVGITVWFIKGNSSTNNFWHFNFYEMVMLIITLFLGIVVTYYLPERNTQKRTFNNVYIEKTKEVKEYLDVTCKNHIINDYLKKDFNVYLLSDTKTVSNKITLLENYAKDKTIKTHMSFIREQFIAYRVLTTDCITSLKNDDELRNKALLKIELMVNKFDEIELALCDNSND